MSIGWRRFLFNFAHFVYLEEILPSVLVVPHAPGREINDLVAVLCDLVVEFHNARVVGINSKVRIDLARKREKRKDWLDIF